MKKFSEFRDGLTRKQARSYSLISGIIVSLVCFCIGILIFSPIIDTFLVFLLFIYYSLIAVVVWQFSSNLIFNVDKAEK